MDIATFIAMLNENSGAIEVCVISLLVLVTGIYAKSTNKLAKIAEDREKNREKKNLNILLGEFETNKSLLQDLEEILDPKAGKDPRAGKEPPHITAFPGIRDDGWNAFRNQGGFQYIIEDTKLFNRIIEYYIHIYNINQYKGKELSELQHKSKWLLSEIAKIKENCKSLPEDILKLIP